MGEDLGKINTVTAKIKVEDNSKFNNNFSFNKSYSGTMKVNYIDTENSLFKYSSLVHSINYYMKVVYYTRHSKKKNVTIKKLNKLINKYEKLKKNDIYW